jgi:hypothetical protein
MQTLDPGPIDVDMAARTGAGAAASRPEVDAPITDNLHDAPAADRRQSVLAAMLINHQNENFI